MTPSYQTVRLLSGNHRTVENGVCVMELASMLAGEPLSDRPRSVSPIVAAAMRGYNDGIDDTRRQALKRFASAAVGTARDRAADRRRRALIRASLSGLPAGRGPRAIFARRLASADPYEAMRAIGKTVAATNDDELHAHTLAFLDMLVAAPEAQADAADVETMLRALDPHRGGSGAPMWGTAGTPSPYQPAPLPDDPRGGTLLP